MCDACAPLPHGSRSSILPTGHVSVMTNGPAGGQIPPNLTCRCRCPGGADVPMSLPRRVVRVSVPVSVSVSVSVPVPVSVSASVSVGVSFNVSVCGRFVCESFLCCFYGKTMHDFL